MNTSKTESASPDLYLRTGKSMILSILKLAEAVLAGYFAIMIFAEELITSEFMNILQVKGYPGGLTEITNISGFLSKVMLRDSMSYDTLVKNRETLTDIIRWLTGTMFALVALDGLGWFSVTWTKKGNGLVRFVRVMRLIASICCLLWTIYTVGDIISELSDTSSTWGISMGKLLEYSYGSTFKFLIYIAMMLAAPIIMIIYHSNLLKITSQMKIEISTDSLLSGKKHGLERVAAEVAFFFAFAFVINLLQELGDGTEFMEYVLYTGQTTVQLLFVKAKATDLIILGFLVVKYTLVCLCAIDFDRAHWRARS